MVCSWVRAELIGVYLKSLRLHLSCERVSILICSSVRVELTGMYFQLPRIQLSVKEVAIMVCSRVRAEPTGVSDATLRSRHRNRNTNRVSVPVPVQAALTSPRFPLRYEGNPSMVYSLVRAELPGMYFKSP